VVFDVDVEGLWASLHLPQFLNVVKFMHLLSQLIPLGPQFLYFGAVNPKDGLEVGIGTALTVNLPQQLICILSYIPNQLNNGGPLLVLACARCHHLG
jgi:hypothetical protein